MSIQIERTSTGIPCLFEKGGGCTRTGDVQLICNKDGGRISPIKIFTGGSLSNGNHALIPIVPGDVVVGLSRKKKDYLIELNIITSINSQGQAEITKWCYCGDRGWEGIVPPNSFDDVIKAAQDKSNDYHCRKCYYVDDDEETGKIKIPESLGEVVKSWLNENKHSTYKELVDELRNIVKKQYFTLFIEGDSKEVVRVEKTKTFKMFGEDCFIIYDDGKSASVYSEDTSLIISVDKEDFRSSL